MSRKHLRILTVNLWNGRADPGALADVIAAADPDAVLTQEMTPEQADAIEGLLPHGLLIPRRDMRGMGIALRRPARVALLPLPRRDALIARLLPSHWDALAAPLEIVNLHISAPTRPFRLVTRRGQIAALHEYLTRERMQRVVAGDLNTLRLMPAYHVLRRTLRDAALERRAFGVPTWSPRAHWPRLFRIDHVLTQDVRALELEVFRVRGSDHSAVVATLAPR